MNWIHKLYDTYENCKSEVGVARTDSKTPLLPLSHTIVNSNIEIVVDIHGNFRRARNVSKSEAMTIAPCTEDSASRGNGNNPHTLFDKLQYVAGDYTSFFNDKRDKKFFIEYIKLLEAWSNSEYKDEKVIAVLNYLKKERLVADLISEKLLEVDENSHVTNKWFGDKDNKPMKTSDIFVRFIVEIPGDVNCRLWENTDILRKYHNHYLNTKTKYGLCYIQGNNMLTTLKHQSKIRGNGDSAKLISANDENGFTYLGRFSDSNQVVSIAYETSQKAHNALKWLVDIQGQKFGNPKDGQKIIVAWGTKNQTIPQILEDTQGGIFGKEETAIVSTEKEFAQRLNKAIAGYGCDLDTKAEIVIMGLDAATTGRLSIAYYRELYGTDFLNRIKHWHSTCIWQHSYKIIADGFDEKGKAKFKTISFIGAPSPKDIATIALGSPRENSKTQKKHLELKDSLLKATVERLLPCIIDGAKLPYDLVNSVVNRVSNPVSMEKWEWEKALTITCALVKKYKYDKLKEVWEMALDENQKDRSYIFGRLLAIAQQIEEYALYTTGEKRPTNAERLMHQFKLHPYKTWGIITDKLGPYIARLGSKGTGLTELMTQVNSMIPYEEFTSPKKLDDSYILGYYCQRQVFIDEKNIRIQANAIKKLGQAN
ncbi:CRISPR-associated protein, Csd1 family [Alkaliphilus metalliredigens QYMF]|uniref:CRISPR-associated protein, Csd1 family n=1 Tax=Alkaliphilus metalliredigens (strain QYMF) TaxID=293826 RepID=A6TNS3_ALKMQ|nr:type I-C CRISPR-associated protein Cas8c/Csd1 [Alkaliphilus metalliredigens]ABR47841.1 CRISPR-associated protein, Csd1 family [Alkaliphilus metalliredigens QYMF]